MKLWIALATWFIYWTAVIGSRGDLPLRQGYDTVTFEASISDVNDYNNFIYELRQALKSEDVRYGIPVLPRQVQVNSDRRFVLVELVNDEKSTTIALDVIDASVVGFISGNGQSFFFNDVSDTIYNSELFGDTNKHRLPYGGSYKSLQRQGAYRKKVLLGIHPINDAITQLTAYSTKKPDIASSLLVVLQMVQEAARLKYMVDELRAETSFFDGFYPKSNLISYEDKWEALSKAIQSAKNGIFKPITLINDSDDKYHVSSVEQVEKYMGLLKATKFDSSLSEITELWSKF